MDAALKSRHVTDSLLAQTREELEDALRYFGGELAEPVRVDLLAAPKSDGSTAWSIQVRRA